MNYSLFTIISLTYLIPISPLTAMEKEETLEEYATPLTIQKAELSSTRPAKVFFRNNTSDSFVIYFHDPEKKCDRQISLSAYNKEGLNIPARLTINLAKFKQLMYAESNRPRSAIYMNTLSIYKKGRWFNSYVSALSLHETIHTINNSVVVQSPLLLPLLANEVLENNNCSFTLRSEQMANYEVILQGIDYKESKVMASLHQE